MAEDDNDDSQKTEDPTHKRLEDARKKGQVIFSREVSSFLALFVLAMAVTSMLPSMMQHTASSMSRFLESPEKLALDSGNIMIIYENVMKDFFGIMSLLFIFLIAAAFFSPMVQRGWLVSFESLKPQISRISPLKGMGRLFSVRSLVEFAKGMFKLVLVGIISYSAVSNELPEIGQLYTHSVISVFAFLGILAARVMIGVCVFMFFVALMDYLYQRFEYMKQMRMSKQEIKEEFKSTEGNPEVKSKLKEIRRERANKRMMSAVPDADVVITNPTHYSIALKYDPNNAAAPKVIAKGQDHIALKIREIAKEHSIPLVENPPLARALYSSVEVDEEIPTTHYHAVAEIIRYVYKLKGKL